MTPDELRALADAATPGPWEVAIDRRAEEGWITLPGTKPQPVVARTDGRRWLNYEADARLIALAPSLARYQADLLDWAERAAAAIRSIDHSEDECGGECAVPRKDLFEQIGGDALLEEFDEMQERPS